jgi:L-lactate dehydrogenase complex protein LldE
MEVDLFIPCFIDQLFPDTGWNVHRVLENVGCTVLYNAEQTCCGQAAFNAGHWDIARDLANKFIDDFSGSRPIVVPSASCAGYVRNYYAGLLKGTIYYNQFTRMRPQVYEFTDFLVNVMKVKDVGARFRGKVTFHDSCAALREYGIRAEPRTLLAKVRGLELVEMPETGTCCGFGGTFAIKHEPVSTAMAEQKVENALSTGAEYIVSTEMSCLMHLDSYIRKHHLGIRCMHIADILATSDNGLLFH